VSVLNLLITGGLKVKMMIIIIIYTYCCQCH